MKNHTIIPAPERVSARPAGRARKVALNVLAFLLLMAIFAALGLAANLGVVLHSH